MTGTRRLLVGLLIGATFVSTTPQLEAHPASEAKVRCHRHWRDSRRALRGTIRCLARKIGSPGGADKAVRVARCESGLNYRASDGHHVGLFQHARAYWRSRVRHYQGRYISPFNARANTAVALKMARDGGWGPWPICGRR